MVSAGMMKMSSTAMLWSSGRITISFRLKRWSISGLRIML
jgi:hypothetical protein